HDYFTPESSNLRSNILPVVENSYYDNCYENSYKNNKKPQKQYSVPLNNTENKNYNHDNISKPSELKGISHFTQSSLNNNQNFFQNELQFLLTQHHTPREVAESKGHDSVNSTNEYFKNKNKFIENMDFNSITNKRPSFNDLSGHNLFINADNSLNIKHKMVKDFKNESFQGDQNLKIEKNEKNKTNKDENKNYNKKKVKLKNDKERNGAFSCVSGLIIIWVVLLWLI
ncbi:hypothetical protein DMUE_5227, partial [Dictyocoela muelleri]